MSRRVTIGSVDIRLHDLRLPMGLVIDELLVEARSVVAEPDPPSVGMPSPGRFTALVGEARLNEFIAATAPAGLSDARLWLDDGHVFVRGAVRLLVRVPIAVVCAVDVVDARQLRLRVESAEVSGVSSRALVASRIEKVNPLFDAGDLPVPVRIERVEIARGRLGIHGAVDGWIPR